MIQRLKSYQLEHRCLLRLVFVSQKNNCEFLERKPKIHLVSQVRSAYLHSYDQYHAGKLELLHATSTTVVRMIVFLPVRS